MERILDAYTNRTSEDYFSRLVDHEEIARNAYSLSITSYVIAEDTREVIDITLLNQEIKSIVSEQSRVRKELDSLIMEMESK